MIGSYILCIQLKKPIKKRIGSLGYLKFEKGYYCYVGSAMGNSMTLENRVFRHLRKKKKKKWHIDYFLDSKHAKIFKVLFLPSQKKLEEKISSLLEKEADLTIKNFGSSDCKTKGNLHYFRKKSKLEKVLENLLESFPI